MSRYIDKDKLLDDLNRLAAVEYNALINEVIVKQPETDVVEVVRCKDCRHSREMRYTEKQIYDENRIGCTYLSGSYYSIIMDKNSYCSYAERND